MNLHKITSSPFTHLTLQHCLQRIQSTEGLLLTQDATYAVLDKTLYSKLIELQSVYILKEDAEARGIEIKSDKIKLITYAQFVELSLEFDKVVSW
jgi:tRNA 2-thiouridine synthesizing protein B